MGSPTEAEIQTQWSHVVNLLETTRNLADGTIANAGGLLDVLQQSLEGDYTPVDLPGAMAAFRAGLSSILDSSMALALLTPILYEYGKLMSADASVGFGAGYSDRNALFQALREWFDVKNLTVESRAITFDTSATAGAGTVGNGTMERLTVDDNGDTLEACTVEKKTFRCRQDQNTGTDIDAEVFEFIGTQSSYDALLRAATGSGDQGRTMLRSHHAGSGAGGSLLTNSSFSDYSATASPKFTGWTETAVGAGIAQDTTNYYRTHPGAQVNGSLKATGGGGTVTLTQTLSATRARSINPEQPYFCRVMVNKSVGTAVGGSVTLRMGSVSTTVTVASLAAGWNEIIIGPSASNWPRTFNSATFSVQVEWSSSTSGFLLFDDLLFAPWDLIDGTYWFLRGAATTPLAWLIDDSLTFTDTGGAPATGKVQWWLWRAGLGCLPSSGTPTFADP